MNVTDRESFLSNLRAAEGWQDWPEEWEPTITEQLANARREARIRRQIERISADMDPHRPSSCPLCEADMVEAEPVETPEDVRGMLRAFVLSPPIGLVLWAILLGVIAHWAGWL